MSNNLENKNSALNQTMNKTMKPGANQGNKTDKTDESMTPVFRLKVKNQSNSARLRYVGNLKGTEKLGDEIVELDRPIHPDANTVGKHAIPIKNIGDFEMIGRLFRCNIVGSHIVMSKRYPLMYLNVQYDRSMVSGSLFQIFYSIDINKQEKANIKKNAQYVNLHFNGVWYRHLDCDDEMKQNYEQYMIEMLEDEAMNRFYKSNDPETIKLRESLQDDEVTEWIDQWVEKERVYYDNLMKEQVIEFKSINNTRDQLVELCTSEKFYKFLEIAMKCREIHRRKKYNLEDESSFVVPKNIIKLDDIKKKMIQDNELILNNEFN
jgi:hypothetical protein